LADYAGRIEIEMVALMEDSYACPGEIQWLGSNSDRLGDILLGINIDGAGYKVGSTAFSIYNLPPEIEQTVRSVFSRYKDIVEGDPWYQSDHSIFIQNGVPALAVTSQEVFAILTEIAHTEADVPEKVDSARLVRIACALRDLLIELEAN
jgi:aminopeptidase YwaD